MTAAAVKHLMNQSRRQSARERQPSGEVRRHTSDRRAIGDIRTMTVWQRMKRNAEDPKSESWLGHYYYRHLLTDTQVETGFLIGKIYKTFDETMDRWRNARSASFEPSFGKGINVYDCGDAEQIKEFEDRDADAKADYQAVRHCYPNNIARTVIERLCVQNQMLHSHEDGVRTRMEDVGTMLDVLGEAIASDRIIREARRSKKGK